MTGALFLTSDFTLPPGEADVVERLRLAGKFDLSSAQFTDRTVRTKLGEMSARARGDADGDADSFRHELPAGGRTGAKRSDRRDC